jgi:hypothetical protein
MTAEVYKRDFRVSLILQELWGAIIETIDVTVDASGITIEFELQGQGATDLRVITPVGIQLVDTTPALSVTLTEGTSTVPQLNYVYLNDSLVLTASVSGWPSGFHAPIATVLVLDRATTNSKGSLKVHAYTDHLSSDIGHLGHIGKKIRSMHANWLSGVAMTTVPALFGSGGSVSVSTTAGVVFQMHPHDMPAFDTAVSGINIVNDPITPYQELTNIGDANLDSNGVSLTNRHYTVVIWGVVSEKSGDCHLMLNLPSGSYNTASGATSDTQGFANYTIPIDFKGVGFLIGSLQLRNQGDTTFTMNAVTDLRGLDPTSIAGGGGGGAGFGDVIGPDLAVDNNIATFDGITGKVIQDSGVATHSHANKVQLDLVTDGDHDVRTDNPHSVSRSQLGLATSDSPIFAGLTSTGLLKIPNATATISGGVITATASYMIIDTESAAAADDLDTINGGSDGAILILRSTDSARDITVKDGTGNLNIAGDFILTNRTDTITFIYDGTLSAWLEISRSDNA